MRTLITCILLTLLVYHSHAQQIGFSPIKEENITPWPTDSIDMYQGMFHFGDSEMESTMAVIIDRDKSVYAQIKSASWSIANKKWVFEYENFENVHIVEDRFFSSKTNGEFIIYQHEGQMVRCLKIFKPWSAIVDEGKYELGYFYGSLKRYFPGVYPKMSTQTFTTDELKDLPKHELKRMKNEVLARYGYIFKERSEKRYFNDQRWYHEQSDNVDHLLTKIEKNNIATIDGLITQ